MNKPGAKHSSLAQEVTEDQSDDESAQGSANEAKEFDDLATNELFDLLSIDAKANS